MIDVKVNGVNIFDPLDSKIDEIIENFVEYYGEQHRERITQRLKNTTCIFTSRKTTAFSSATDSVEMYYKDKTKFIYKLLFSSVASYQPKQDSFFNTPQDAVDLQFALVNNKLDYKTYDMLTDMIEMFNLENPRFPLENYSHATIDKWLQNPINKNIVVGTLNKIILNYETKYKYLLYSFKHEKELSLKQLKEYDKVIDDIEKQADKNVQNIIKNYILDKNPNFKNLEQERIEDNIETFLSLLQGGAEEFLSDTPYFSYQKNLMMDLFKNLGFDFGENLDNYKKSAELIKCVFNPQLLSQIIAEYKENAKQACINNPYFKQGLQIIQNLKVKGGNLNLASGLLNFMYNNALAGATMLQYVDAQTNELKYLCIFPDGVRACDQIIYHEFNHVIESDLLQENKDKYITKTGFDVLENSFLNEDFEVSNIQSSTKNYERTKRSNEILSEVINDYISVQVCKMAQSKNKIYTFGGSINSMYSVCNCVFKEFFDTYKDKIIECRLSKDPKAFEKFIGVQNVTKMSNLAQTLFNYELDSDKASNLIKEIMQKTGIMSNMLNRYKEYIYKDISWSSDTQKLITQMREVDDIFRQLKIKGKENQLLIK